MQTFLKSLGGLFLLVVLLTTRAAAADTLSGAQLKGAPELKPAGQIGIYLWAEGAVLHVRWTAINRGVLFEGSLSASANLGKVTRINEAAGGWVHVPHADPGHLVFSATTTGETDGFDVMLARGTGTKLDIQIDMKPADPKMVFIGEKLVNPSRLPLRFAL